MKFLANENVPLQSAEVLKAAGFDVKVVGVEFAGVTDREVMETAIREGRAIVTFDRHYGQLIFQQGYRPPAGVVFLRWKRFAPDEPGKYPVDLFKSEKVDLRNALTVIDEDTIRQRRYTPEKTP